MTPRPPIEQPRPSTDRLLVVPPVRVSPDWLALREPADAQSRSVDLVEEVNRRLSAAGPVIVYDLGCGTGSMGRWLSPMLPPVQHWVMYDRDPELLALAAAGMPAGTTVETRQGDITRLDPAELAGPSPNTASLTTASPTTASPTTASPTTAPLITPSLITASLITASLITASALLDMMTADELERLVTVCVAARCPALITISVIGRVELTPADPLDDEIARAFNDHQRRTTDGGRLLGPDAPAAAIDAFTRLGADVLTRPSPWRLGADHAALAVEWLTGWVAAACAQEPGLTGAATSYLHRRLADAAAGRLTVTVHHQDILALPPEGPPMVRPEKTSGRS